jgi:hypothetical protein
MLPPHASQVLRGIEAVARLKEVEGSLSSSEMEELTAAEAAWRPLAEHALQQQLPRHVEQGGAAGAAAAAAAGRQRRALFAALRREQKRQWQDDEFRRRADEAKQTKHEMEMAQWRRSQKVKAKVERWHEQMWAESGVDAPPSVVKTPQLRPRRPTPSLDSPAHRKPPPAPIRFGVD